MALTKVSRGLLTTSIVDNGNATAITIDSSENVGIGASPSYNFHVTGSGDTIAAVTAGASSVAALNLGNSTNLADGGIRYDNSANALILRASNAERMRIDSAGRVGISITPKSGWVTDAVQLGTNLSLSEDANSAYLSANAYNSSTGWKRVNNQLAGYIRMGTNDGIFSFSNAVTGAADSVITWQERFRIDGAAGNVGIGAVPSAWRTAYADKALDLGTHSALYDQFGGSTFLANNFYRSNDNSFKYKTTGGATAISLDAGQIGFLTAPSGTAGATATLTTRMTLDASGNLLVGTTTAGTKTGDGVIAFGATGGVMSNFSSSVANNGTLDIAINTGGGGYQGFLSVANTVTANAAGRTQSTFSVFGRSTDSSIQQIATDTGTSGATFTVTTPSNGVIRVTNTSGATCSISMHFFGGASL